MNTDISNTPTQQLRDAVCRLAFPAGWLDQAADNANAVVQRDFALSLVAEIERLRGAAGESIVTTADDWADNSEARFDPWTENGVMGWKCTVNGVVTFVYLNPSTGGDSPDVFVYMGGSGDPAEDGTICFLTPDGVPGSKDDDNPLHEGVTDENAAEALAALYQVEVLRDGEKYRLGVVGMEDDGGLIEDASATLDLPLRFSNARAAKQAAEDVQSLLRDNALDNEDESGSSGGER